MKFSELGPNDGITVLIRRDTRELALMLSLSLSLSLSLPCEDRGKKWPCAGQQESSHKTLTMLVL